jgi:nucleoid DNA-binding protein
MNHRQLISAAARRFPDLTQRQIDEVLAVLVELWRDELAQRGGAVILRDFGTLSADIQQMRTGGCIRAGRHLTTPPYLKRVYIRLRPTSDFRAALIRGHEAKGRL